MIAEYLVVVGAFHVGLPELSCVSTMYAHVAADTVGSVPQKIAATDKNNIFLFSVAASDGNSFFNSKIV